MAARRALVLGGGVAGATAAVALAQAGVTVTLAEKDDFLGGHAARLGCKALESCQLCNGCLVGPSLAALRAEPGIEVLRRCRLTGLEREGQGFRAGLSQRPALIDPARCDGCGLCQENCPAAGEGAMRRPWLAGELPPLAIDPQVCLYFKDGRSALCRDVCPEEAIDFTRPEQALERAVEAVVLATGFQPYPAMAKPRLGLGLVPNVITALELETMLRERGGPAWADAGRDPKRVAFIQCVGSRERLGHNYCSRVCCAYAMRLGRALAHHHGAEVTIFHMDLQGLGGLDQPDLAELGRQLNLMRAMPYDVMAGENGRVVLEYQARSGEAPRRERFDLVVLSVGLAPNPDNAWLGRLSQAGVGADGFLLPGPGVFVAGAAGRPLDVAETMAAADRTAWETIRYLEGL